MLKKCLKAKGINFKVMDAPRALTAECGMSIQFTVVNETQDYQLLINHQVSSVYRVDGKNYILLWRDSQ